MFGELHAVVQPLLQTKDWLGSNVIKVLQAGTLEGRAWREGALALALGLSALGLLKMFISVLYRVLSQGTEGYFF